MASIDQLRASIDLHDLAGRLGLERPGGKGNYRSPGHDDHNPSLSIYDKNGNQRWRDFSMDTGGDLIDLVQHVQDSDTSDAIRWLHQEYNIPLECPQNQPQHPLSRAEYIAQQCRQHSDKAIEYLTSRGIAEEIAERAIQRGALGFNRWISSTVKPGQVGHGGDAVAFIVNSQNPGRVVAVDLRYLDPSLNGGLKTQTQGEKLGYPWLIDHRALERSRRVCIVESPINALSVESADINGLVGLATRGTQVDKINWQFLRGKEILICMDNDEPDAKGHRPGPEAAWRLHERLTADNMACHLVDQGEWQYNDVNDILSREGAATLKHCLNRLEPWAIPGVRGDSLGRGRTRVFLPTHDLRVYWRFRCKPDFTTYITDRNDDADGNAQDTFVDLCGFRIAAIARVTIASASATMTGTSDTQPSTLFAVAVQSPYHGNELTRVVCDYQKLHNIDFWQRCGPVWQRGQFLRLVNLWGRAAHIGARQVMNFVGLGWKQGKLTVGEGADCYFTEPEKQCPYHNLTFPSGPASNARQVIEAYQKTFSQSAGALLLIWALGAHLKCLLSFWPHCVLQADKAAGKSTLIERLSQSISFTMFSGQSLQTEFRLLTSIGHTSHPVGWEELSARGQKIIDKATSILQEAYKYTITRRGAELTEFLNCAPVLLAGEDVPVRSLLGKVCRVRLEQKGPLLPANLPVFPVRQWLDYLAELKVTWVREQHEQAIATCTQLCRASGKSHGAARMIENYAALLLAWELLQNFAGIEDQGLKSDLITEMNAHVADTSSDREPWVWIVEVLLAEIAADQYRHPMAYKVLDHKEHCLVIRPRDVMHHLQTTPGLREIWDGLPVKSHSVFKRQLHKAGVIYKERVDVTFNRRQECHLIGLSIRKLAEYGLDAGEPGEAV